MKYLEIDNTTFPRVCEIKYFACYLDVLDITCSSIEELIISQVTIKNQFLKINCATLIFMSTDSCVIKELKEIVFSTFSWHGDQIMME